MIFVGILALGFYWCTMKTTTNTSATKTSAAASHTTIVSPSRTDTVYIVGSFQTTHISIFHYWVAVISRLRQSQYKLAYITPVVCIPAMFTSQRHGITHMMESTIIGS